MNGGKKSVRFELLYDQPVAEITYDQISSVNTNTSISHYQGFSGGPILNACGSVVGIAIKQIEECIGYISISKARKALEQYAEVRDDWKSEDYGPYGYAKSIEWSLQKVEDAKGRYDSYRCIGHFAG